jgi:hypothetical protein
MLEKHIQIEMALLKVGGGTVEKERGQHDRVQRVK